MEPEVIIDAPELQVLLNLMKEKITLKYPLYEFDLLSLRPSGAGYTLNILSFREDFEEAGMTYGDNAHEMPSYNDLLQSMLVAGIINYTNQEAFDAHRQLYGTMNKNVVFSLDTNMLYNGFPSQSGIDPSLFLVVDTVENEIKSSLNYKYSAVALAEMKRCAPFEARLLDELVNRKTKRSRLAAYAALPELEKIRDKANLVKEVVPSGSDKEKNDSVIVRSLREFEREKYSMPFHLTADVNVASLCKAEGSAFMHFEFPGTIETREVAPQDVIKLLFRLATAFGVVKCNSVILFGEFKGKGNRDQHLKAVFRNPDQYDTFVKELELCRALMKLKIEK